MGAAAEGWLRELHPQRPAIAEHKIAKYRLIASRRGLARSE
jgi:hypothetical protein